ncbi:hypothetical protein [Pelobacter propionicus]|uniref:Uncharacterized protein n=1 Tax=Pelobacter propionicus (strain DSM 2379 / NBRC 103807 / OttBd1) TaxID=338966 RepID=A1ALF1_PELPD|nr:hypothetical protein [Pelobacter propionicus]ABK98171.1 hypothetical protein Ppro_0540 [Pelobacter propionicus DSM 2379]
MSESLRIALIAEGPTDKIVIEAALKAILQQPFVLIPLQPEPTRPDLGGGWCGVLKWCREFRARGYGSFEEDPTLELYDFFILHLDADVAHKSYSDVGPAIEQEAQQSAWGALPCFQPCPPPGATVNGLKSVLFSWLGVASVGSRTVLCIPSKSTETWLAVAVYPDNENLLNGLECTLIMEGRLASLSKGQRIRKSAREYTNHAATITGAWDSVRAQCSQADVFHNNSTTILMGEAA